MNVEHANEVITVTVVIAAYNAEKFLAETVQSVLRQTLSNLELLIVDDGSSDNTLSLARSFNDSRVRILTGPNRGRAFARNRGFEASSPSEFIAFVDADDLWDVTKLEDQVDYLQRNPEATAVGSFMRYISADGKVLGETGQVVDEADAARIRVGELLPFPISSCLIRTPAFVAVGGFDASLQEAEDLDLIAKLASLGKIGCVPAALGSYRIHGGSASVNRRALMKKSVRFVRARIAAKNEGVELTWEEFSRSYRPSWRQQRNDVVQTWYRSAALAYANGERVRAAAYGLLALMGDPIYTVRRIFRQRLGKTLIKGGSD